MLSAFSMLCVDNNNPLLSRLNHDLPHLQS